MQNSRKREQIKMIIEGIEHLEQARTKFAASESDLEHEIKALQGLKDSAWREIELIIAGNYDSN